MMFGPSAKALHITLSNDYWESAAACCCELAHNSSSALAGSAAASVQISPTPLVLVAPMILASVPFWASYQNIWIAMGEGITAGQAFNSGQRLRFAHTYALITLLALIIAVGYWKLIKVV